MQENNGNAGIRRYFLYKPNNEIERFKNSTDYIVKVIEDIVVDSNTLYEVKNIFNCYLAEIDRVIVEREKMDLPFNS